MAAIFVWMRKYVLRMRDKYSMADAKGKGKKGEASNQEKIVATFQQLRNEQRAIANKISELEGEKKEHECVQLI